jgi:hypothetical protein
VAFTDLHEIAGMFAGLSVYDRRGEFERSHVTDVGAGRSAVRWRVVFLANGKCMRVRYDDAVIAPPRVRTRGRYKVRREAA